MQCEHAFYTRNGGSVQCRILNEQGKKWAFCVHQYLCRASGKYEISKDAAACRFRNAAESKT